MIGVDGADLLDRECLLGRTVGDIEQMVAGVHFRLNLDHLAVAGDPIRIHFHEWIALLKNADKRIDLLRLERAVKRHFPFGFGFVCENFLALLSRKLAQFG